MPRMALLGAGGPLASFDADALTIFAAFTTPPDGARKTLINNLVVGLKADSLWTKTLTLHVFAAADAQASLINFKSPGTFNATNPTATAFTADQGYTGNATDDYINLTVVPSTDGGSIFTQDSAGFACYILNNRTTSAFKAVMSVDSVSGAHTGKCILEGKTVLGPVMDCNKNTFNNGMFSDPGTAQGMWVGTRTASTIGELYRNGTSLGNISDTSSGLADQSFIVLANRHGNGSPDIFDSWTDDQVAAAWTGGGLNDTEAANLSTRINNYMAGLPTPINVY